MSNWLLYGANGYSGKLIAKSRGLEPILAGRSEHSIKALAKELGLRSCIFDLNDPHSINKQLAEPWGDVSTAYYTTGIPNIEVYIPISPKRLSRLKKINYIRWLLGFKWIQNYLKSKAQQQKGPDTKQLQEQLTYVWGEVKNAQGDSKTLKITTANGYALTVIGSLTIVEYLLKNQLKGGYKTPSQIMGADFINTLPSWRSLVASNQVSSASPLCFW